MLAMMANGSPAGVFILRFSTSAAMNYFPPELRRSDLRLILISAGEGNWASGTPEAKALRLQKFWNSAKADYGTMTYLLVNCR
jgi:hypothetical protein